MDNTNRFIEALWASFHLSTVLWIGAAGALAGLLLGLTGTAWVHRKGWMMRRVRWHHLVLKLQFMAVPCAGLLLGLAAGLIGGMQHEANRQIDRARPKLQALSSVYVADFTRFVATWKDSRGIAPRTPEELVDALVTDYLAQQALRFASSEAPEGWWQRQGLKLLERFRAEVIGKVAQEMVVKGLVTHTGMRKGVAVELMRMPFDELLVADFLVNILKKQVAAVARGWWLGLLFTTAGMAGLMALEVLVSRHQGWHVPRPPAA